MNNFGMREFAEKRRWQKILYSRASLAALLVVLFFVAKGTWGVYQKEAESGRNLEAATRELNKVSVRKELLTANITRLRTERGAEEEIRNRFRVAKPGEELIVIVDSGATGTLPTLPPQNLWEKFMGLFR